MSARLDAAVQNSDLEGGRQDVRQEQDLLVRQRVRELVNGRVRERHAGELGLEAVDQVPEDPASAPGAQAVVPLATECAAAARRDARDEDAVVRSKRGDAGANLHDGPDRLVAEDCAGLHLGDVALEDV